MAEEEHELPNAPQYLVRPIDARNMPAKYLTGEACIIDFGESYEFSAPSKDPGLPVSYCSPEILFREPAGAPSDIWALACTLFEIRSGQQLIHGIMADDDDFLMQMTQLFGNFQNLGGLIGEAGLLA
jgi:serine/threonine protein kinase